MTNALASIAAQVRHDLCRHQIGEREHVIVDLLLRLSFDLGRPFARLSRLEDITACRGISRGNVHAILEALETARIIVIERDTYRVLPLGPTHHWLMKQRKALADQDTALALLVAMQTSEQPDLLPRDKSLLDAVAELAVETANVPESGTGSFPNREQGRSRIGNEGRPSNIRYTSDVVRPERPTSAQRNEGTINDLKQRVRAFVGEADFVRYWDRTNYDHLWTDDHCRDALDRALRDCKGRLADKVPVRRTRGAMLWNQFETEKGRAGA